MYQQFDVNSADSKDLLHIFSYCDSPDLQATIAQERTEILRSIQPQPRILSSIPHASAIEDIPRKMANLGEEPKQKNKSKCVSLDSEVPSNEPAIPPKDESSMTKLPLPKRSKSRDTIRRLFPAVMSDLKSTIHWQDFVATMCDLGFHSEHRGGSEWTFKSLGSDEKGRIGSEKEDTNRSKKSIVIHEPHPQHRLAAVSLQWIGKRLSRRFGLGRESFEDI